jgi:hypothetical protein
MRVSADPIDAGYRVDFASFDVTLDGQSMRYVVTADAAAGEVICVDLDADGRPICRDGSVQLKKMHGRVELSRRSAVRLSSDREE